MKVIDVINDLPRNPKKQYKTRAISSIDTIVIHHSATESGTPEAFARYHVDKNKWPGIGYHYVIGKQGEVWQTNEWRTISYHAVGWNGRSLGICLVGNFDVEHPTPEQWNALLSLITYLFGHMIIERILGHRETGAKKTCPGKNFDMDKLREMVGLKKTEGDT